MKNYALVLFIPIFCSFSCSKVGYIVNQAKGQIALEYNGESTRDYLLRKDISDKNKKQVKDIQKYKKFFYDYFNKKSTSIYDAVTILKDNAVTYLVVASPKNKIEPIRHDFPIVGSFPYLGFFELDHAKRFEDDLKAKDYSTYLRNVYAYSTLNQWIFNDNILSSFFMYEEKELARLIFHELFHTVLFIPDEVGFNESAAQYFSEELVFEYFFYSDYEKDKYKKLKDAGRILNDLIVSKSKVLSSSYKASENYSRTLNIFIKEDFKPSIKQICRKYQMEVCWPLKEEWNNAKFAAFNTYEANSDVLRIIQRQEHLTLKELYTKLQDRYKVFKNLKKKSTFKKYLIEAYKL